MLLTALDLHQCVFIPATHWNLHRLPSLLPGSTLLACAYSERAVTGRCVLRTGCPVPHHCTTSRYWHPVSPPTLFFILQLDTVSSVLLLLLLSRTTNSNFHLQRKRLKIEMVIHLFRSTLKVRIGYNPPPPFFLPAVNPIPLSTCLTVSYMYQA